MKWTKLNKVNGTAQPILTNDAEGSDLGVRDPHLIRSAEGDRYWILGTDLHAEGGGAGGSGWNQLSASKNIIVWESTDLVSWSEPKLVYAGMDTAGCVWAPEAIYDKSTGDYVVYWSVRDNSKAGTNENALRVYVCRTRDFNTFTEPKVWLSEDQDSGSEVNIIDTTIVEDEGTYYRFSTSDWNTIIDVSDTLDTEDVFDVRVNEEDSQPNGSWRRLVNRSGSKAAGFDRREGLTVYQLPDGKWCVMGDNEGYKAFVTSDLSSGSFTAASASFPDGAFRHGTVVRLSATEEARIMSAYQSILEKVEVGTVPGNPSATMGTDDHTAVVTYIDRGKAEITPYVRRNTDLTSVPVKFSCSVSDVDIIVDGYRFENGDPLDLSKDLPVEITADGVTYAYTLKAAKIAYNPILPGQYADPDIDYFDGKYWIYPTTDGFSGWGGTVFHAWSSDDLLNWEDEGVILDVKEKSPGVNEKGVEIASSPWSDGNAWAPTIEEKDGKYYFYYCGNVNSSYTGVCGSGKAVGVAVSDSPNGPFVAQDMPIIYPQMMKEANFGFNGQVIDPSIFTDEDGTSYLFFGNGTAAMVQLNDDMVSVDTNSFKRLTGLTDFRESVIVTKRDGLYHFTWSCDDTGSPNYHVNYGTAEKLDGAVTYRYTLLSKEEDKDILGTAHQSVLYLPDTDECYIAYHRFYTPIGVYTDGLGYHRETCIDRISFDEETGLMKRVTPTMQGVYEEPEPEQKPEDKPVDKPEDKTQPATVKKVTSITAAPASKTLNVGQSYTITTKVLPVDATNKGLSFTSKNSAIASVSSTGTVKAKKAGSTSIVIKAKDNSGVTATVKVTVRKGSLKVSEGKTITLKLKNKKKKSVTLNATVKNLSGTISWKVTKGSKYIKLNKKTGKKVKVTAKKAGTAKLTISCGGKTVTKTIKVKKK